MARTDIRAVEGLDAAIDRAKALVDAGADAIFPEAMRDLGEFEAMRDGARRADPRQHDRVRQERPVLHRSSCADVGVNIVIWPVSLLRIAMGAAGRALDTLNDEGHLTSKLGEMQHRADLYDLIDYEGYNHFDTSRVQLHDRQRIGARAMTRHDQTSRRASPGSSSTTRRSRRSTPRRTACSTAATPCRSSPRRSRSRRSRTCCGTASCRRTCSSRQLRARRALAPRARPTTCSAAIDLVPLDAHPMDEVRTAVSVIGARDSPAPIGARRQRQPEENLGSAASGCSPQLPAIVAYGQRRRRGQELVAPRDDLDYSANFLWMTFGEEPDPVVVDAFNRSMILYAEHSFNASTFTARVITSTLSDLYSAVVGAIGALKGPLHGGANEAVMHIFDEIGTADERRGRGSTRRSPRSARSWASGTASTSAATRACPR